MLVGVAENVLKVRGQSSRSQQDFYGWGIHFDSVASSVARHADRCTS